MVSFFPNNLFFYSLLERLARETGEKGYVYINIAKAVCAQGFYTIIEIETLLENFGAGIMSLMVLYATRLLLHGRECSGEQFLGV